MIDFDKNRVYAKCPRCKNQPQRVRTLGRHKCVYCEVTFLVHPLNKASRIARIEANPLHHESASI